MLTSETNVRVLCCVVPKSTCVLAVWGEFEGRLRWVLHGIRGLRVRFCLEKADFSVSEKLKCRFG